MFGYFNISGVIINDNYLNNDSNMLNNNKKKSKNSAHDYYFANKVVGLRKSKMRDLIISLLVFQFQKLMKQSYRYTIFKYINTYIIT